jgi:XTP/dITP diphosphohydrolase
MIMDLLVATRNKGKLKEIERLLADTGIVVKGLDECGDLPEVVEDGDTFAANARKKAATMARLTGYVTLADDSGLAVEALGGQPGIYSARYAGDDASDADNNRKLLEEMTHLPGSQRQAAFHCVLALCTSAGDCQLFEGRLDGVILEQARGEAGFGYDPLFMVPEYGRTLAELPLDIKNRISHRGQALKRLVEHLHHLG